MLNLGKIIIFLTLVSMTALASVTAKLEPAYLYEGETATYVLTITGDDVVKPDINDICGNDVTATSSQTSIESINGSYKKSYILSYQFTPRKNCTIEPIDIEIDSKIESSNSVNLVLKERKQELNAEFVLSLEASKKELYVGEPLTLTLLLKQRKDAQAVDSKFVAPAFKGFWIKSEGKAQRSEDGDFIITKVLYKLAPQREGTLQIDPASLKIAKRTGSNNWGTFIPQVKWRTYYSNSIDITAKALPNNAKIVGDFTLNATVDKTEVNPNEPVKLSLVVKGEGNLEDIEGFKPYINDVNIFDEKIIIKGNKLSQKLVFVGEKNFTIAPFELVYFDTKTQKLKKIVTEPIEIKVRGNSAKSKVEVARADDVKAEKAVVTKTVVKTEENYLYIALAFVIGLILGVFIMLFKRKASTQKSRKLDLNDEKLLLIKLLPFKDIDNDVLKIVEVLEANIYSSTKQNVDKKLLKELCKKYDIS